MLPTLKQPELPTVTVTLLGGTISINGLTFTEKHEALPALVSGNEYVFLLKQVGNRYHIPGRYFGVFLREQDRLRPVTRKTGFAPELSGVPTVQATRDDAPSHGQHSSAKIATTLSARTCDAAG